MKIKTIEINNYKAFYKKHSFDIGSKNVFVYGENGSGKSSLYYALKDFFQSSREDIDFDELENIFINKNERGKGYIKVTFNPDKDGNLVDKAYLFSKKKKDTYSPTDNSIRDAIGLKSFLTYKHLLGIHNIKKGQEIDLFDLLVKGVLKHFRSTVITGGRELGELWDNVEFSCKKELDGNKYKMANKKNDVEKAIGSFNKAFRELFKDSSADNINKVAQPILDEFKHGIRFKLFYKETKPNAEFNGYLNNNVSIKLYYLEKEISEPHLFLNEARLSAIAISIYLGMVKRHPQLNIKSKILFLDDIFIGLDIANRLPLFDILENHFSDYQKFITTYDKPWYEYMKFYLEKNSSWKTIELYSRRTRKGFEQPVMIYGNDKQSGSHISRFITQAEDYYNQGDNKAAGVYLRSAFEFILKRYCLSKALPVSFKLSISDLNTDNFWIAIKDYKNAYPTRCNLTPATTSNIESFRKLVLNPLSHHDINKHEISSEIISAIGVIRTLRTELNV
ncbi:MAG: AAA family ATPase [Bacteroidetes bacterium]|nr:AAA family ATPase [Bacteroidota bacterium]